MAAAAAAAVFVRPELYLETEGFPPAVSDRATAPHSSAECCIHKYCRSMLMHAISSPLHNGGRVASQTCAVMVKKSKFTEQIKNLSFYNKI